MQSHDERDADFQDIFYVKFLSGRTENADGNCSCCIKTRERGLMRRIIANITGRKGDTGDEMKKNDMKEKLTLIEFGPVITT